MKDSKVVKVSDETFEMVNFIQKETGLKKNQVMEKSIRYMAEMIKEYGPQAIYGLAGQIDTSNPPAISQCNSIG